MSPERTRHLGSGLGATHRPGMTVETTRFTDRPLTPALSPAQVGCSRLAFPVADLGNTRGPAGRGGTIQGVTVVARSIDTRSGIRSVAGSKAPVSGLRTIRTPLAMPK